MVHCFGAGGFPRWSLLSAFPRSEILSPPGGRVDFLPPQHPETILDSKEILSPEAHPGMWIAREISSGNAGGHLDWERLLARQLRDKPSRFLGRKGSHESGL